MASSSTAERGRREWDTVSLEMWIVARYGVFSVFSVRRLDGNPDPDLVVIRAYDPQHLSALRERLSTATNGAAITMPNPCELIAPKPLIGSILADLAAEPEWPDRADGDLRQAESAQILPVLRGAWARMAGQAAPPRCDGGINRNAQDTIMNAEDLTAAELAHDKVLCPACGQKVFTMWPEGWDGHAGWNCPAVEGATPEERKANYKARFRRLFR